VENDLLTNKKASALLRDSEQAAVDHQDKPIELRVIDQSAWDEFIHSNVTVPEHITRYLNGRDQEPLPMTEKEVHSLEKIVEDYHSVKAPFYISMSLTLQQTGRPWAYVPEAGKFVTGFTLGKE
jgi:hypothetical protein